MIFNTEKFSSVGAASWPQLKIIIGQPQGLPLHVNPVLITIGYMQGWVPPAHYLVANFNC